MSRLIRIPLEHLEEARQLTDVLKSNDVEAEPTRTLRGNAEVHILKPRFRRTRQFMVDVDTAVRRWLEEKAPNRERVTAQVGDRTIEFCSPLAQEVLTRTGTRARA